MLTRPQLEVVARREGVPVHVVERDYVQHVFLRNLPASSFTFKGGTCLRIVYGSPRYSEDVDFHAEDEPSVVLDQLKRAVARLADYGMRAEVVPRSSREGTAAVLRYQGPLFTGDPRSRGSIRLEVSLRGEPIATEEVFVPRTPYPDVPQLVLRALAKDHLLAEKARALVVRGKARDLFDVHFLLSHGFAVARALLDRKMSLFAKRFTRAGLERGIASASRAWDRDLEPLLGQVPPLRPIAAEVRERFRAILVASTPGTSRRPGSR